MSRRPENRFLADQMPKLEQKYGKPFELVDLATLVGCSRQTLHRYTTGRKACPKLEVKLAEFFGMSVAELRRKLGLRQQKNVREHRTRRKS